MVSGGREGARAGSVLLMLLVRLDLDNPRRESLLVKVQPAQPVAVPRSDSASGPAAVRNPRQMYAVIWTGRDLPLQRLDINAIIGRFDI